MTAYKEQLKRFRLNARYDCLVIHDDIKRLIDDATEMLDYNNSEVGVSPQHMEEKIKLKKLRYYYSEIMECLELSDALFNELRENEEAQASVEQASCDNSLTDTEDTLNQFINACVANVENWDDLMGNGSDITLVLEEQKLNNKPRTVTVTISDGS